MMRFFIIATLLGLLGNTPYAIAEDDEVTEAKAQLSRELELIERIHPSVERLDLARLQLIKKNVIATRTSIETHGLSNMKTISRYQELIVCFRYSVAFFRQIETEETKFALIELLQINDQIIKARGFDDTPYTQITSHVFTQMRSLVLQLTNGPVLPAELQEKVKALVVSLGKLIAVASEGDRPRTFEAAIPVYRQIEALYPEFNEILRSHAAFDIILEIQGLNEFYAEYAQINSYRLKESGL